ncbi:MAG TPA: hypothetical protein VLB46_17570 [Pyrinomonadaceae bacterium]|nr:hypothetical protein [Pyrinomonadaceae bacterium]
MDVEAVIRLAQKVNERDHGYDKNEETRHEEAPDKAVNHVFGFKIQRAARAPARVLFQHISAIPARFCVHGVGLFAARHAMHYSTGPGRLLTDSK